MQFLGHFLLLRGDGPPTLAHAAASHGRRLALQDPGSSTASPSLSHEPTAPLSSSRSSPLRELPASPLALAQLTDAIDYPVADADAENSAPPARRRRRGGGGAASC